MGDWYDVILTVDLRPDTPPAELAELRWHLGLGERPANLTIVTGEPGFLVDDNGDWVFDEDGTPIIDHASGPVVEQALARRGPADRISGVLGAALQPREDGGWALSARQELHPDELDPVHQLITWLAHYTHSGTHLGSIRFHEETHAEPLVIRDEQVHRRNTPLT